MRQAKDPHFKKGGGSGAHREAAGEKASAAAMPPPASQLLPKRKKGLDFKVLILALVFLGSRASLCMGKLLAASGSLLCTAPVACVNQLSMSMLVT